jgi:hypothetical protein
MRGSRRSKKVYTLFMDLDATEGQLIFLIIYTNAKLVPENFHGQNLRTSGTSLSRSKDHPGA